VISAWVSARSASVRRASSSPTSPSRGPTAVAFSTPVR
jgi:hypothetical protein